MHICTGERSTRSLETEIQSLTYMWSFHMKGWGALAEHCKSALLLPGLHLFCGKGRISGVVLQMPFTSSKLKEKSK